MSRTAFVTIAGRTNAGKSSLLNAIVGEKIASVSSKPQTTRTRITGIRNIDDVQLVFFDTPGLHKPVNKLSEHMLNTVRESVSDIDAVVFVMDCTKKINQQELDLLKSMNSSKMPVILVLNKIDLLKNKDELAPVIADLTSKINFRTPKQKSKNFTPIQGNHSLSESPELPVRGKALLPTRSSPNSGS
ncbi:MAG: GTPase Era [Firmicutes bacterium ADurb.BinA205]|nr:MAG: GTPase Era [Firmicutes bacterium ADurb.BinA205]